MNPRSYALVTSAYWAFTVTDGALRMLVLLYFHDLGYSPVSLALLFLLYELFGVFTNLFGGVIGSRVGLHRTLVAGLGLQVAALVLLSAVGPGWSELVAVAWVMAAQALSGIAKDLTKLSAKSAVKFVAGEGALFRLVALLTGSKNALKGIGFFVGAALLGWLDFRGALWSLAFALAGVLFVVFLLLDDLGLAPSKPPIQSALSKSPVITRLSVARFFLFGSRDIWFVVALPVFLDDVLGWSFEGIGAFLACWVIGYGIVQSAAPRLMSDSSDTSVGAVRLLLPMAVITMVIAVSIWAHHLQAIVTIFGLLIFGVMFALTSAVHSYLVLAYSKTDDDVVMDVGYYYSANAAGRLVGTLLSGLLFVVAGFAGALFGTAVFLVAAFVVSLPLPRVEDHAAA